MSRCRFCESPLTHTFVDLGMSPLCESFLTREQLNQMEPFYPLHAYVCGRCFLAQIEEYVGPERIFDEKGEHVAYHHHGFWVDVWAGHAEGLHWPCPECGSELS